MRAGFATLVDVLAAHAVERPGKTAVTFLEDGETRSVSWTYSDLYGRAAGIASALRRRDLAGRTVLLAHPPGLDFIAALFGCFNAGAIAVPTCPPRSGRGRADIRLAAVVEDARPALALTDAAHLGSCRHETADTHVAPSLEWLATDDSRFTLRVERADLGAEPDAIAMLQYTSGSTRAPAGVALSHRNLMENQHAIAEAMGHDENSRFVSWLPPYHDMGLIGAILQPIALGSDVTLMAPKHAVERPIRWLRAISRTRATTSGAPDSMFAHCVRMVLPEEREGLDLGSWRIAFNGSEPVRAETMQRFAAFFAPCGFRADAFFPCYGLAESTLLVSGESGVRVEAFEPGARRFVSCGTPARGIEVAVVDPGSLRTCGEDETGEIWLSGTSVARGYWKRPEATHAAFENGLPGRPGLFLRTGDLGLIRDGRLFVAGRLKDLVILGGRNYYPQDIEACAGGSHAALSPTRCAAFSVGGLEGERLVVACEMPREAAPGLDTAVLLCSIRDEVASEMDVAVSAVQILKQGELPRTTSGKIRRGACRQAFLDRTWDVVDEWPSPVATPAALSPTILDDLAREVTSVLNAPGRSLDPERPLAGQGLDSLGRVELILRLEAKFRVSFDPSSVSPDATLRDLEAAVARARSGRSEVSDGPLSGE
ncbi:MAG TPA: AMP-binding protein [Thermoanaerobaculia bacterium]|nr:AMP-binding protein [Thermoanaerobaculia bacterium]